MKRKFTMMCAALLISGSMASFGQDNPGDKRMSPQEQAAFEKSVPLNPSKNVPEAETADRTSGTTIVVPPVNWKAGSAVVDDRPLPPAREQERAPVAGTAPNALRRSQPEPQKTAVATQAVKPQSGSRIQPEPVKTAKTSGSPVNTGQRTQPELK
jgi:hypothetical protein